MFCGSKSFSHMEDDDPLAVSSPRGCKKKRDKNPYAARGLDKFSVVLAELQSRREKIMARTGAQGVALIRFMYDSSQDWVPIIVRPKAAPQAELAIRSVKQQPVVKQGHEEEIKKEEERRKVSTTKKRLSWCSSVNIRRREGYYWTLAMVLILLSLVMFGRVFAICCTSIWWYMVPTIQDLAAAAKKRRDFNGRRLMSGKNLVVQSSFKFKKIGEGGGGGGGLNELASPRGGHGNGKKG